MLFKIESQQFTTLKQVTYYQPLSASRKYTTIDEISAVPDSDLTC